MGDYMKNVTEMTHPLIQHKISRLRDKKTTTNEFRSLVEEIAMLMGFEALKDLPTHEVEVETPIETCMTPVIEGRNLAVVPILRAGLGMVNGILNLVPTAKVGHIGLYRDEETHEPHEYYCKMPKDIDQRICLVVDPMLATGGSLELAYQAFLSKGKPAKLHICCVIASRQGIERLQNAFPGDDVTLWVAAIDPQLNDRAYIVPGLGDAGDLSFGEKQ